MVHVNSSSSAHLYDLRRAGTPVDQISRCLIELLAETNSRLFELTARAYPSVLDFDTLRVRQVKGDPLAVWDVILKSF
jgi:hypothetical protein